MTKEISLKEKATRALNVLDYNISKDITDRIEQSKIVREYITSLEVEIKALRQEKDKPVKNTNTKRTNEQAFAEYQDGLITLFEFVQFLTSNHNPEKHFTTGRQMVYFLLPHKNDTVAERHNAIFQMTMAYADLLKELDNPTPMKKVNT